MFRVTQDGKEVPAVFLEPARHHVEQIEVTNVKDQGPKFIEGIWRASGRFFVPASGGRFSTAENAKMGQYLGKFVAIETPIRDERGREFHASIPQAIVDQILAWEVIEQSSGHGYCVSWRSHGVYHLRELEREPVQLTEEQHAQLMREGRRLCPSTAPWPAEPGKRADCTCRAMANTLDVQHEPGCPWRV